MELVNYLINTLINALANDPIVLFLLAGLLFVSIAGILIHIPASKVELTNDKYTPTMSANNAKRKNRYN